VSSAQAAEPVARQSVRFRGRSFMALVLAPEPPLSDWLAEFDSLSQRSPGFFVGKPVIVDIAAMPHDRPSLVNLMTELTTRNVRVLGLEGADPFALGADARGLPPIMSGGRDAAGAPALLEEEPAPTAPAAESKAPSSKIIADSVRSGQAVYFPHGDVTVTGSIASGAEVIAGGSIHVYGTLRGRAIAGSTGEVRARIFCRRLEAELLAIDGLYKTAEDMDPALRGRPVQAWLEGDAIRMAALA
jgi:septum site-determining protein MinC